MTSPLLQLPLDLAHYPALGGEDFLVSACNRDALLWIERWPEWPAPGLCLYGPEASGKSHLAAVWRQKTQANVLDLEALGAWRDEWLCPDTHWVIEDVPAILGTRAAEENLFHLYNHCRANRGSLLMTGRTAPATWAFLIPDLGSRIRACPAVAIGQPDDALLAGVLLKLFSDRQLRITPDIIKYILPRLERSFAAVANLVDQLDTLSLAQQRPVSLSMLRMVLPPVQEELDL